MFQVTPEFRRKLDEWLTAPMVGLSFLYLVIFAIAIPMVEQPFVEPGLGTFDLETLRLFLWILLLLEPVFVLEFLMHWLIRDRSQPFWSRYWFGLIVCLLPPLRIGMNWDVGRDQIWIPLLGWRTIDQRLREQLQRFFSIPMILIALMILPILAIEYWWYEQVMAHPWLLVCLDIAKSLIWLAFAVEFILRCTIAESKLFYCKDHWIDLLILVLPLLAFARALRLLQLFWLLPLDYLARLGRYYRIYGLALKFFQALLLLDVLQRLFTRSAEKKLQRLQKALAVKEAELTSLKQQIATLESQISKTKP